MRTLLIYASVEGQTQSIAQRIAQRMQSQHSPVDCYALGTEPGINVALDPYDAVIAGSSVHYGHLDAHLAEYLGDYRQLINEIPSAFFSVSLAVASDDLSEQSQIQHIVDRYVAEIRWTPLLSANFAGALKYSRYSWWKRWMMKSIARKEGGPTDDHHDYEFTRWEDVDQFADRFISLVNSCRLSDEERSRYSAYTAPRREYSVRNRRPSLA